jgi:dynein heavy chain, axonemal
MSTINSIQSTTLSVELKIKEMQETFNVLEEHRIQVSWGFTGRNGRREDLL